MPGTSDEPTGGALEYAKEVYAACATVGFDNANVRALKRLLDGVSDGHDPDAIADVARLAQRDAVAWAMNGGSVPRA